MKKWVLISILIAILLSVVLAMSIYFYNRQGQDLSKKYMGQVENEIKQREELENKIDFNKVDVVAVSGEEEKTTPNTKIVKVTYYTKCGHTITEKEAIASDLVNLKKEQFEKKKIECKIVSFSTEKVETYEEQDNMCKEHYMVREKDGYIAIYNVDEKGKETLKEITGIVTNYLPETDLERLREGIKANGKIALNTVLEDYE